MYYHLQMKKWFFSRRETIVRNIEWRERAEQIQKDFIKKRNYATEIMTEKKKPVKQKMETTPTAIEERKKERDLVANVLIAYRTKNMKQDDVAKQFGISQNKVSQIIRKWVKNKVMQEYVIHPNQTVLFPQK